MANGEVDMSIQHSTLRRYIAAPKMGLPDVPNGHGVVHNIAPLYDSLDEDGVQVGQYEEPIVLINTVRTCTCT